ncbi:hypothetical protein [Pseudomonas sp. NPDC090208]|uniref:hypothetical protein n=1 Tax=Pseudomonas sp. NPDC090208 TaxID=3364478 RepID=UPI0038219BAA
MGKIGWMLVAKASEEDLRSVDQVVYTLEAIGYGRLPDELCVEEVGEAFDVEDRAQCQRVMRHLLAVTSTGSVGRAATGLHTVFDPRNEVLALDSDVLELHPRLVQALAAAEQLQASGWAPLTGPGQIQEGDFLSFTVGGTPMSVKARMVLNAGTDREEVVYNRHRNFYFVTSMAVDGTSTHKNVFVRSARPAEAQS